MTNEQVDEDQADDDELAEEFGSFVLRAINAHPLGIPMKPSQIAAETLRLIDPDGVCPEIARALCRLALKRLARQMLDQAVENGKFKIIREH